ncbi:NAD(P)-dependent oxidoreductase [Kribbella turkmenica]|uniref:NAD(P)-dependent oxidoreductase n=1 Tax=Kribbella turkmenica TaxID=2530375 RepID=A0A4R4XGH5_9ACTN|nr:NAD(P)-binding domain-containing protein [Kribbella turkmenica]TDD29923.1 NAD(P)-dependent oxidoreductase [Kribbella turkmenica]
MSSREAVTVIGLGAMGSTMAEVFLAAGHPTTVWNRTAGKAGKLVAAGAAEAATAAEAVAAGNLVVISQVDYAAMDDSLAGAELEGRVLVNLSSDNPDRLRAASLAVADRGGTLVTGGIMVPPPGIGQPGAYVFYSGPAEAVEAHRETLQLLGRADYMGTDPGLAMLYYQAMLNMFWTTLTSYMYSAALVGTADVGPEQLRPYAAALLTDMADEGPMGYLKILTTEIAQGVYPGEENNLHMQAVGSEHVVDAFEQVGLDTGMPRALAALFASADAAGHGRDGLGALTEAIRKPAA